jgi:hypothetical protein
MVTRNASARQAPNAPAPQTVSAQAEPVRIGVGINTARRHRACLVLVERRLVS